jgi:hypothetical protein
MVLPGTWQYSKGSELGVESYCPVCHKKIYWTRHKAQKALNTLRSKTNYTGRIYSCPYTKNAFHLGRRLKNSVRNNSYKERNYYDKKRRK